MSLREDQAFQDWANEVKVKFPEEARANFEALLAHDAAKDVFRGHLREKDYYQRVEKVAEERKALEADKAAVWEWWEAEAPKNKVLLAERDELLSRLEGVGGQPMGTPSETVSKTEVEELRKQVAAAESRVKNLDGALPNVLRDLAGVLYRANREGFDIDPSTVVNHSVERSVTLSNAYEALTADARAKRAEADMTKALQKAKEEGAREALSKLPSPDYLRGHGPSVTDVVSGGGIPSTKNERLRGALNAYVEEFGQ